MTQAIVEDILSRVKGFPSLPQASVKLMGLLDDSDTPVERIEEVLKLDPGLTANVLRLANSAYFGLPHKIGSIRQAVVILGNRRLVKLVMASCVNSTMNRSIAGYDLPAGDLWKHSLAVSVAAEGLLAELKTGEVDVVFTAALLHDVGKMVLGDFISSELAEIESVAAAGVSFEIAERRVLGTDHAEIGARILEKWAFPAEIVQAVRFHHDPDQLPEAGPLIDVVHIANMLCLMVGIGVGREGLQYEPSDSATKRLGLKPLQLERVASQTLQWVSELNDAFNSEPIGKR